MRNYKHVLIAVELIENNDAELIKRAVFLTEKFKANVVLVHAIEYAGGYGASAYSIGLEVEKALIDKAKEEIKRFGKHIGISEDKQLIRIGSAKFVILEEAEKLKADLIIVGSHGMHGLQVLLGSTANAVLHGAKCDVMAVRLKK